MVGRRVERGERRVVGAVEAGYLPISVALEIWESDDQGVQAALHKAYEDNLLRGRALIAARRLVEVRKRSGKAATLNKLVGKHAATTPEGLVKAFQEDTERKRIDRKSVVKGKSVSVRLNLDGRRIIKKKQQ